ncbi:MAG: DUF1295 domain-containing protein [Pirellulaceae bacterium]
MILAINLALIACVMSVLWLVSLRIRNVSIVDVFWGVGFVLVSWTTFLLTDATSPRRWMMVATATLWGTRLAGYLAWRNIGKPEDYRYAAMRDKYAARFVWKSAVLVFGLQGLLIWKESADSPSVVRRLHAPHERLLSVASSRRLTLLGLAPVHETRHPLIDSRGGLSLQHGAQDTRPFGAQRTAVLTPPRSA